MAKKKKHDKPSKPKGKKPAGREPGRITVRRVPGRKVFELAYPPSVRQRAEDIEEVRSMLAAGEADVAVDELRWLLSGCHELLEGHQLLGQIAMDDGDLDLAQGHLGYAFELGVRALPKTGLSGTLSGTRKANRPFFEAGKALVECFKRQAKPRLAADVVNKLLELDPSDPLQVKALLEETGPSTETS